MDIEKIIARLKEIGAELEANAEGIDIEALRTESEDLIAQRKAIEQTEQARQKALSNIAKNSIGEDGEPPKTVTRFNANVIQPKAGTTYDRESPEYRNAFLKRLIGQPLTEVEQRADTFVNMTANEETAVLMPKQMDTRIVSYMTERHPLLSDVRKVRSTNTLSWPKHVSIDAGRGKIVEELNKTGSNAAQATNVDLQNTFVEYVITTDEYNAKAKLTYRMATMSLDSLEEFISDQVGTELGNARGKEIVRRLLAPAGIDTYTGIHAEQKIETAEVNVLAKEDIFDALALFNKETNMNNLIIYTTPTTFYKHIVRMGDKIINYTLNYQDKIPARVFGMSLKFEDALEDGQLLILDPNEYVDQIVQPVIIERARDIEVHKHIISGYEQAGGMIINDRAGVLLTIADE